MAESKDIKHLFNERFTKLIGKNTKQKDVAEKIGTTRQTVSNWLSGNAVPDMYALVKIATAYKVSVDYLLGLTDQPTNDKDLASAAEYLGISQSVAKEIKGLKTDLQKNILKDLAHYLKSFDFGNMIENTAKMIVFNEFHYRCIKEYCVMKNIPLQFDDDNIPIDEQGVPLSIDTFNEWLFDYDEILYKDYKNTINDLISTVRNSDFLEIDEEFLQYKQTKATERLMDSLLEEMYGDQSYFGYCKKYVENIFNLFEQYESNMFEHAADDINIKFQELFFDFMGENASHRFNISDDLRFIDHKKAGE